MLGETELTAEPRRIVALGAGDLGHIVPLVRQRRPARRQRRPARWQTRRQKLGTVQDGQAKEVPDETWYLGLGVTAADEALDDIEGHLAK